MIKTTGARGRLGAIILRRWSEQDVGSDAGCTLTSGDPLEDDASCSARAVDSTVGTLSLHSHTPDNQSSRVGHSPPCHVALHHCHARIIPLRRFTR